MGRRMFREGRGMGKREGGEQGTGFVQFSGYRTRETGRDNVGQEGSDGEICKPQKTKNKISLQISPTFLCPFFFGTVAHLPPPSVPTTRASKLSTKKSTVSTLFTLIIDHLPFPRLSSPFSSPLLLLFHSLLPSPPSHRSLHKCHTRTNPTLLPLPSDRPRRQRPRSSGWWTWLFRGSREAARR